MPEGGGGGGGGGENDYVRNYLTDPCKNAALTAISAVSINNMITQFYNAISTSSIPNNIIFVDGSVIGGGPGVISPMGNNSYVITLSNDPAYGSSNMSQEAWGAVIAHEIIHVFLLENPLATVSPNQHVTIFTNFVKTTSNLLQSGFGMSATNATKLALNGLADLWTIGGFSTLCLQLYGYYVPEFELTYNHFTTGGSGIRCN